MKTLRKLESFSETFANIIFNLFALLLCGIIEGAGTEKNHSRSKSTPTPSVGSQCIALSTASPPRH